jgi:hypothetical protein
MTNLPRTKQSNDPIIRLAPGRSSAFYGVMIKRRRTAMTVWMVQVIYADGTFEDRYIAAASAADAIKAVRADTPPSPRRWARFIA